VWPLGAWLPAVATQLLKTWRNAAQVQQQPLPADAEDVEEFWDRVGHVYDVAMEAAKAGNTCVVAHAAVHSALLCNCLGLTAADMGKFRMSTAGVTIIEFPFDLAIGVIRCAWLSRIISLSDLHSKVLIRFVILLPSTK
jgi:broad specificity phosphatase PhoE